MRGYRTERTYRSEARERSFTDIAANAMGLLRQDIGEFLFIGALGGLLTTSVAMILRFAGGAAGLALITPAVALGAIITMAVTCAAVQRVRDGLDPEAGSAFASMLVRLPFLVWPLAPALLLAALATFAGVGLDGWIGSLAATAIGLALLAFALVFLFRRSLYIPALFVPGTSSRHAWTRAVAVVQAYPFMIALGWALALFPTIVLGALTIRSGFDPGGIAVTAFVCTTSMPYAGALMSLLFAQADGATPSAHMPAPEAERGTDVAERIRRGLR